MLTAQVRILNWFEIMRSNNRDSTEWKRRLREEWGLLDDSDIEYSSSSHRRSTTRSNLGSNSLYTQAQYPPAQRLRFAKTENWDESRLIGGIRAITFGPDFAICEYVPLPPQNCTNLTCLVTAPILMPSQQSRTFAIPYGN